MKKYADVSKVVYDPKGTDPLPSVGMTRTRSSPARKCVST